MSRRGRGALDSSNRQCSTGRASHLPAWHWKPVGHAVVQPTVHRSPAAFGQRADRGRADAAGAGAVAAAGADLHTGAAACAPGTRCRRDEAALAAAVAAAGAPAGQRILGVGHSSRGIHRRPGSGCRFPAFPAAPHDRQRSRQAESQQTPSTQNPDWQAPAVAQAAPRVPEGASLVGAGASRSGLARRYHRRFGGRRPRPASRRRTAGCSRCRPVPPAGRSRRQVSPGRWAGHGRCPRRIDRWAASLQRPGAGAAHSCVTATDCDRCRVWPVAPAVSLPVAPSMAYTRRLVPLTTIR